MSQQSMMEQATSQQNADQKQKKVATAVKIVSSGKSEQKFANTDCWDKILDWLSVEDVISFGQTCKAFNWVAGQYFQWKYPALKASHAWESIIIKNRDTMHFSQYIQRLNCLYEDTGFDEKLISTCKSLRSMDLFEIRLSKRRIKTIKAVLGNLEEISIYNCDVDGHFYDNFLKFCVNLKILKIDGANMVECMPQKYPSLERLQFESDEKFKNHVFNRFFQLNPHVRNLSVSGSCIWKNWQCFMDSHIQLNDLTLDLCEITNSSYIDMLNKLHQRGFYKRLHYYPYPSPAKGQLAALKGLVTLYIEEIVDMPQLPELKELGLYVNLTKLREEGLDVSKIPNLCTNLKRLIVDKSSVDDILTFIRHSPYLNVIAIRILKENILNLSALNKERMKLNGAEKVTIYVDEDVYLATKWSTTDIDLDLIEMQRIDSYEDKQPHDLKS